MKPSVNPSLSARRRPLPSRLVFDLLFLAVLFGGAFLRFTGLDWGEYTYMHPDERFLVWVTNDIAPVNSLAEYFDTARSTLNPNNRGHGFYVYGTLPIFLTRYLANWLVDGAGWNEIVDIGRPISATLDLMVVVLVYLSAARLFDRRVGLLAGAFYALAVLPIQLSHYYKEDTFANLFTFLAFYFAARILTAAPQPEAAPGEPAGASASPARPLPEPRDPVSFYGLSLGFGLALGCAVASKLNAAPVALLLPAAFLLRFLKERPASWERRFLSSLVFLALAGAASLLVFRVFQPYAFSGPGILGIRPNPQWVANIQEQRNQAAGDVDFPPALQWARRPVWFAWQNLVVWGLGLPLGLLAWAGFLWAGWRMLKGDWQRHALLWGWTAFYFAWQSAAFNPTMRYFLPIYPTLAIFAGWALVALYDLGRQRSARQAAAQAPGDPGQRDPFPPVAPTGGARVFTAPAPLSAPPAAISRGSRVNWARIFAVLTGAVVLVATATWAYAFIVIYQRPLTRVAASRWVLQNVPGPVNARIQTGNGVYNQPLPFPQGGIIGPGQPYITGFQANASGSLSQIFLAHVADRTPATALATLAVSISTQADGSQPLSAATFPVDPAMALTPGGSDYQVGLPAPVELLQGQVYYLVLGTALGQGRLDVCGPVVLHIQTPGGLLDQTLAAPAQCLARGDLPLALPIFPQTAGQLTGFTFMRVVSLDANPAPQEITVRVRGPGAGEIQASGSLTLAELDGPDSRGRGITIELDRALPVAQGESYQVTLSVAEGSGAVALAGSAPAIESTWDDGIPLRLDGYDPFGGIYSGELNFEMYWDDTPEKLARFLNILDRADAIFITSNRQWATTTRVPERYPLTSEYYRRLLGCPPERSVEWCYNVAQVGTFQGDLGFELVQVFDSSPRIGPLVINDQFAEEAFTVYDHPKVFIFRKTEAYDSGRVASILKGVDLASAVHITPRKIASHPGNLMLPADRWDAQRQGGTWSELFDTGALQNRSQLAAALAWYLSLGVLGLAVYPLLRLGLPGLSDRGYPLARAAGLLLLSYLAWLAGSLQVPFTRPMIAAAALLLGLVGLGFAFLQRKELARELRERRRYFLLVEGLFLGFFLLDLFIRFNNPDLWHPYHGGEKPMDFAYFNAILKSTSFPPYDPWYAGGYLNYYYYGFLFVGVLAKLLGIVPAIAYNLILPTIFAMIALGAFSLGWNLVEGRRIKDERRKKEGDFSSETISRPSSFVPALGAALGMALLGNLGTVRMIWRGYQMVAAPNGVTEGANLLTRWVWSIQGFFKVLGGTQLPYGIGDWYWIPSRAIPAPGDVEPITEFPFFTILYGDPHAHLFALPVTLLVLSFALSVVICRGRWRSWPAAGAGFFLSGLFVGALRPINTPDSFLYLPLAMVAVGAAILSGASLAKEPWKSGLNRRFGFLENAPEWAYSLLAALAAGGAVLFAGRFVIGFIEKAGTAGELLQSFFTLGLQLLVVLAALAAGVLAWRWLYPRRTWLAVSILAALLGAAVLGGLASALFQPFTQWYGLGYNQYALWKGTHTPTSSYLIHWGLFLFLIVSWMAWETRDWLASTPASSLRKLDPYKPLIQAGAVLLLIVVLGLTLLIKVAIAWLVLPLAAWAGVLLLRPGQPDVKRFVLFLVGTGLVLTLVVEVVVLVGDIGRMNTVFKLYLQVWTLFAISAAAALAWVLADIELWWPRWRAVWQAALAVLVFSAALYPLMGGLAKLKNRAASEAPRTLDGMAYMPYASYQIDGQPMPLAEDYSAIRWMQENIQGSPVIVEGNLRALYQWGSRIGIYTGLPGVVGWEWHQQQQRALLPGDRVTNRILEIDSFYQTTDLAAAQAFLEKYDVRYIVLGLLERGHYPGPGLEKFPAADGVLWREVFREGQTAVYEVIGEQ